MTAPYILATKLDAFAGRDGGDYLARPYLKDSVTLLDERAEIVKEVTQADPDLRHFLIGRLSTILTARPFLEVLPAHLPTDVGSQARLPITVDRDRLMVRAHP